jgi:hypothetical protein
MNTKISKIIFAVGLFVFLSGGMINTAKATTQNNSLSMEILSSDSLNGTAGDYVNIQAQIKNTDQQSLSNIATYLSLMDENTKLPVDLEDWSAEKGQYIGIIDVGQTLPLNWKIHFVKPGDYSLIIVAEVSGQTSPQTSTIVHFHVNQKHNLNPGQVLPVALGMPILLLFLIFIIQYRRNKKIQA